MPTETLTRWMLELSVRGGHKYFIDFGSEPDLNDPPLKWRIAVVDESGSNPDNAEHPLLYLDRSRPILLDLDNEVKKFTSVEIPVVFADGRKCKTPAFMIEAMQVAERFKMHFEAFGGLQGLPVQVRFDPKDELRRDLICSYLHA